MQHPLKHVQTQTDFLGVYYQNQLTSLLVVAVVRDCKLPDNSIFELFYQRIDPKIPKLRISHDAQAGSSEVRVFDGITSVVVNEFY